MKQGILVVSFGTSYENARKKGIGRIEKTLMETFPDWEIRRAFTSGMVLKVLRERDRIYIDNVRQALERLAEEGFQRVVIQPTHVINGIENDEMIQTAQTFQDRFESLSFGAPLLTSTEDYQQVVEAVTEPFSQELAKPDTALVFMGHGTSHHANAAYAALDYWFRAAGYSNILVGTVEGSPDVGMLIEQIKKTSVKRVILAPFMVVAGDHARNDMSGSSEDSWESQFEREGFSVDCVFKGLGEYPLIRQLYVRHALEAIQKQS